MARSVRHLSRLRNLPQACSAPCSAFRGGAVAVAGFGRTVTEGGQAGEAVPGRRDFSTGFARNTVEIKRDSGRIRTFQSLQTSQSDLSRLSSKKCFSSTTENPEEFETDLPESYRDVSLHNGFKVQASLLVSRLPTQFSEPEYCKEWREFQETWKDKTGNSLALGDDITFMRFPFHFLESKEEIEYKKRMNVSSDDDVLKKTELEMLLENTGLDFTDADFVKKKTQSETKTKAEVKTEEDKDPRSVSKLPKDVLWLCVKYKGTSAWTFPRIDRLPVDSMRDTLQRLCMNQLGPMFTPHYVGQSPFAWEQFQKAGMQGASGSKIARNDVLTGGKRKVFYYRAHHVSGDILLGDESPVEDYMWLPDSQLKGFMSKRILRATAPGRYLNFTT